MLKNVTVYLAFLLLFTGCHTNKFKISGKLTGAKPGELIFLDELKSNLLKTADSVKVSENGAFSFKGEVKAPSFYQGI